MFLGCEDRPPGQHDEGDGFVADGPTPPTTPDPPTTTTFVPAVVEPDPSFVCGAIPREPAGVVPQEELGGVWATLQMEFGYGFEFGFVGDVNGDGCDDIATSGTRGSTVLFGPLGRGSWGTAEANLRVEQDSFPGNTQGRVDGGADIDGDGRDEFWVAEHLWSFDGVTAHLVFDAGHSTAHAEFVDADSDGAMDVLMARGSSLVLAYGPLSQWDADVFPWDCRSEADVPDGAACLFQPESDVEGTHHGDVVADVTGDGLPDFVVQSWDAGGGYERASLYAGGDFRGQLVGDEMLVDLTGVVVLSYPVLGDLDGDGFDELAATEGVLSGATLLDADAELLIELPEATTAITNRGDVDGDGVDDLHLFVDGTPVLVSGSFRGLLPPNPLEPVYTSTVVMDAGGSPIEFDAWHEPDPWTAGDITGDGRADLLEDAVMVLASDDLFPD
jgi:hypothetical protein